MKILIATDTYYPDVNGAAYFTYRLASALAKKGHNVSVLCPSRSFKNTVVENKGVMVYGVRSVPIMVYKNFRVSPLAISGKTIERVVKEISPDVIHVQNHFMIGKGAVVAAKKLGIPVMGTNHFMPENLVHYFHLPKIIENWLKNFGWKQCIKVFERLDYVTTPTKTAAELLKKAGFGKNVEPVSCGIDLLRFNPENDGSYLKKIYAIPADGPVMLYVGRLDKEKKIEVILRALPDILLKTDVHFVLAGVGENKQKLEALAEKLGVRKAVKFVGFIPDKDFQNIYRIADVFVIASIAELQSIVTMEAMASGLPVIAVNAMALPELVHDGENGYLFPDGDSKALAEKVLAVLLENDLKEQMSKKSLEIIKAHDLNKTIDKYESIYNEITNRRTQNSLVE